MNIFIGIALVALGLSALLQLRTIGKLERRLNHAIEEGVSVELIYQSQFSDELNNQKFKKDVKAFKEACKNSTQDEVETSPAKKQAMKTLENMKNDKKLRALYYNLVDKDFKCNSAGEMLKFITKLEAEKDRIEEEKCKRK